MVLQDEAPHLAPLSLAMSSLAVVLGGMIVFNAFFGAHTTRGVVEIPTGASTHVAVTVGGKTSRTITLKYDEAIEEAQRELLDSGHFKGLVDGVTGPQTKLAIENYQRENQLQVTGETSPELIEHIRYTRKLTQASEITGSLTSPLAIDKPGQDTSVASLQRQLAQLGYDPGSTSGTLDGGTRSAILAFELDNGLAMEGVVSAELIAALEIAAPKQVQE